MRHRRPRRAGPGRRLPGPLGAEDHGFPGLPGRRPHRDHLRRGQRPGRLLRRDVRPQPVSPGRAPTPERTVPAAAASGRSCSPRSSSRAPSAPPTTTTTRCFAPWKTSSACPTSATRPCPRSSPSAQTYPATRCPAGLSRRWHERARARRGRTGPRPAVRKARCPDDPRPYRLSAGRRSCRHTAAASGLRRSLPAESSVGVEGMMTRSGCPGKTSRDMQFVATGEVPLSPRPPPVQARPAVASRRRSRAPAHRWRLTRLADHGCAGTISSRPR